MSKDQVRVRVEGQNPTTRTLQWFAALVVPTLAFVLIIELASLLRTGEWAAGGWNPLTILTTFLFREREWTGDHTLAAVLVAAVLAVLALLAALAVRLAPRQQTKTRVDDKAKHLGKAAAFTETAVRKHAEDAQLSDAGVIGLAVARVVSTGKQFWVGFRDGLIALMGPGSGKTAAMVVTGALDAPGPVWVTSNKPDVVAALLTSRADKGRTFVFDPQQIANMEPEFFYDPLSDIRAGLTQRTGRGGGVYDLDQRDTRATELAQQFARSSRPADAKTDAYFDSAGQALLANLLLAAAIERLPLTRVLEWTFSATNKVAAGILRKHGKTSAYKQVEGIQDLHPETRDSVYQTASTIVGFLKNEAGRTWIERVGPDDDRPEFDPDRFVRSSGDMMICLSREGVGSFGPILAAMTNATIRAAENYAATCQGGRLPVPMVMQLDEVANVCRITGLPDLVSHVGSRGIFIAPYLQSPAQGRAAWGADGWDKLFGASVVRILGRGLIDIKFLEEMSKAIGDQPVVRHTTSHSHGGRQGGNRTYNSQWSDKPIMPVSELVSLPQWRAVSVASGERAALLELIPYFRRDDLREKVARSKQAFLADHPELEGVIEAAEESDEGSADQDFQVPAVEDVA